MYSKIRNPKNFTSFAQEAVIGALSDVDHMWNYVKEVKEAKLWFAEQLNGLYFVDKIFESYGNFLLIRFIDFDAKMEVFNYLNKKNIFVRNLTHSDKLMNCLRISIGTKDQMKRVLKVIKNSRA